MWRSGSGIAGSVRQSAIFRALAHIGPAVLRRFLVLLISIALISPSAPVFSMEKREVYTEDHIIFIAGFEAYKLKDYATALQNFTTLFDKYPDTPLLDVALFWTSRTYYKMGNQMEAARNLSQLIKQYPDTPLRGFVEDDLLELTSRYVNGEKLPVRVPKNYIPKKSEAPAPAVLSIISKKEPEVTTSGSHDTSPSAPAPTATEKRNVPLKPVDKPVVVTKNVPAITAPSIATPAGSGTVSNGVSPVAVTKSEAVAPVATQVDNVTYVREILAGESSIDIVTGSSLNAFKTMRLTQPDRLVIDIPGAINATTAKTALINSLGISRARIGTSSTAVRIVLDATKSLFPFYDIKPFDKGLRITVPTPETLKMDSPAPLSNVDKPKAALASSAKPSALVSVESGASTTPLRDKDLTTTKTKTSALIIPPISLIPSESGNKSVIEQSGLNVKIEKRTSEAMPTKSVLQINGIIVGDSYIDIVTGGNLADYKAIKLTQPDRLVIDISGAKNAMPYKSITINRLGISKARIGTSAATVRIVLDSALPSLPMYDIKQTGNGLRITFK